ncbi:MAG: beta-glucosidase [Puniceicoccaceae bacterium]|nr:MAG: beta-glucosidase [Puniceicoccaceae bacterium]
MPPVIAPYRNPNLPVADRVADLLAQMTWEEKIAQLTGIYRRWSGLRTKDGRFLSEEAARTIPHGIGSISRQREGLDPAASAALANAVQDWHLHHTRLGIPAFFHVEVLHGDMEQGGTHFPQPLALAASWDEDLIHRIFTAAALEVRCRGGHHVLGPNLDLGRDPRWGRTEETYGEDPWLVARLGVACVKALQGNDGTPGPDQVLATGKHYAAHGQPEGGTNAGPVQIPERLLRDLHLFPFEAAVREARLASIMPAYHEIDGLPCHADPWLLQSVLREEWGFDGFLVADYFAIDQLRERHAVAADKAEAGRLALDCGVDCELPDPDCFPLLDPDQDRAHVDAAVARVLKAKFELGLFENARVDPERAAAVVNSAAHRELALEAALRSIVLLKNDGPLLPFDPAGCGRVAVIGPNARRPHLGGYSDDPGCAVSVLDGLRERLGADRVLFAEGCKITVEDGNWWADTATLPDPELNRRLIEEAAAVAAEAGTVVLVLGGNEDTHKEGWHETHLGDRDSIELPGPQLDLFRTIAAAGKPFAVVLIHSGPLAIPEIAATAPAILDAFYPGQAGGTAVARLLFGDAVPSGKLAITYPRSTGQIPAAYNHKPAARRGYLFADKSPLFAFGHGLSYTTFHYGTPRLARDRIRPDETTELSVEVENTGARAGDEIVQFYLRDEVSRITRPVKELKGFARIHLAPGEKRTVTFPVGPAHLAYTGPDLLRTVEPGTFALMVGPNSVDLQTVKLEVSD